MNSNPERRAFVSDSASNIAGQVVALAFGIASGILLARALGVEGRGIYGMLLLLPQTIAAFATSGIAPAVAYSIAKKKWDDDNVFSFIHGVCLYLSAICFVVLCVLLYFKDVLLRDVPEGLLILATTIFFPMLFTAGYQGVLLGKAAFRLQMRCTIGISLLKFVAIFVPVIVFDAGLTGAVFGCVFGSVVSALICYRHARSLVKSPALRVEFNYQQLRSAFTFGGKSSAANAIAFLNYRLDMFLVHNMAGSYAVGLYALGVGVVEKLWIVASNAARSLFPRIAASQDYDAAASSTARVSSILLLLMIAMGICAGALAELVPVVYGPQFSESVSIIRWLLPGVTLLGYSKVFSNYVAASGQVEANVIASAIGLAINVTANLILIPIHGVIGAAIATSCSYSVIAAIHYRNFLRFSNVTWSQPFVPQRSDVTFLCSQCRGIFGRCWRTLPGIR